MGKRGDMTLLYVDMESRSSQTEIIPPLVESPSPASWYLKLTDSAPEPTPLAHLFISTMHLWRDI